MQFISLHQWLKEGEKLLRASTNLEKLLRASMSYELYEILSGAVSLITGEKVRPTYGGEDESFLNKVVTPIYRERYAEALKNKNGVSDHSTWRNYDDLNEFFWSPDCFKLGWPMRLNNDLFFTSNANKKSGDTCQQQQNPQVVHGSSNSEPPEHAHQVLIIMAWLGLESPLQLLDPIVFEDVLSIFITNAVLRVIQGIQHFG